PLPCVSSVQVARPRCASSPAALLPPRANSNRMLCPDPPPDPAASATLSSDRHCRGDNVEGSSSQHLWVGGCCDCIRLLRRRIGARGSTGVAGQPEEHTGGPLMGCARHPSGDRAGLCVNLIPSAAFVI